MTMEPGSAKLAHAGTLACCSIALSTDAQQNIEFYLHVATSVAGVLAALCSAAYYIAMTVRKAKRRDEDK